MSHGRVAVVGAGVGGLTAAYRLVQAGFTATVFESEPKAGGRVETVREGGYLIDTAATARTQGAVLALGGRWRVRGLPGGRRRAGGAHRAQPGLQEIVRRTAGGLAAHIERGQRDGWIDPGSLPAETAAWLAWMIQRGQGQLRTADDSEFERELDAYVDIIWRTLYAPAPATGPTTDQESQLT